MALTLEEIEQQLLTLPEESRRRLAERLWDSVATPEEVETEFTPEQLAEFERRMKEVEDGTAVTYSHETVMREVRELLRTR